MNRDSLTKMRLDRRLLRRKGWIDPGELERALSELPDAEAKLTTLGDVEDAEDPGDAKASEAPS